MGLKAATRQAKYAAIGDLKVVTAIGELCKGLPNEFGAFLNDVRRLEFQEEPRYSEYRLRFRDLFIREKFVYDSTFDWDVKKPSLGAQVCETLHTAPLRSDVSVQNLTSLSNMPAIEHAKKAPSRQVKRVLAMPSIRAPPSVRAPHRGIH
jgi:hypothetical protein